MSFTSDDPDELDDTEEAIEQVVGLTEVSQTYPSSTTQIPLHPSPSAKFLSSQATEVTAPSPHTSDADA
jgi:hypothetical protein